MLAGQVLLPAELLPMLCAAESDLLNFVEDFAAYEDMFLVCHFLFSHCLHLSLDLRQWLLCCMSVLGKATLVFRPGNNSLRIW